MQRRKGIIGTHYVSIFIDRNTALYFNSFDMEYILQEVFSKISCWQVVAEKILRTLKDKIYRKMIPKNSKSDLGYLNKLVDKYNNIYQ